MFHRISDPTILSMVHATLDDSSGCEDRTEGLDARWEDPADSPREFSRRHHVRCRPISDVADSLLDDDPEEEEESSEAESGYYAPETPFPDRLRPAV